MLDLIETLTSFVPAIITHRLAVKLTPITSPTSEKFPAAVLFADISGFTALTEHLAQKGPVGAEELTSLLNSYFGQLIDLIAAHGGDIVKFAGDALIALWPVLDPQSESLATAVYRAAQCSLAVQTQLNAYEVAPGIHLSLKLALGAGEILTMHLGGVYGRWEFLVTGSPLVQVGRVGAHALPGDIILSPEAWTLVQASAEGEPVLTSTPAEANSPSKSGNDRPGEAIRLHRINEPVTATAAKLSSVPAPPLTPEAETGLRAYLPGAILARLVAGQTGWLAELRLLTILFVNLPDLDYTMPLEQAQILMQTLQTALYHFEGSVNKLSVDDKGVTLVAALGLPPLAHEDDAGRGIQAALSIQAELHRLGWHSAIGVTTGRAFCGVVGNTWRREYTMIGDVVNLAARLMQAAPGKILGDAATYQAAKTTLTFEELPSIKVKGKADPVSVYRPLGQKTETTRRQREVVGRESERNLLTGQLQALLRGSSSILIIEGEAGIGKSCLTEDLLRQAHQFGLPSLVGAGNAIDKSTPYHAWRPVFQQLFDLDSLPDDPDIRREHVLKQIERNLAATVVAQAALSQGEEIALVATLSYWAPLLNPVLALDWPENEITRQMTGKVRADNTHELLVRLLQLAVHQGSGGGRPYLLVLEDGHWLDSASWALIAHVAQQVQPLLLVLVTRPLPESLPPEYSQLLSAPSTRRLRLDSLSNADVTDLVCRRLGVAHLPESLAQLIYTKTGGNPFFAEELAYALRDSGMVIVDHGECHLSPQAGDWHNLYLPDTVQGVITSRIDRLTPAQQLTLKVASVIGRTFEFNTLHDIHPIEADRTRLTDYLSGLSRLDITLLETPEPDPAYIFKHIITQEVAYNMMLFSQRRELHRAVADWYEQTYADDLSPYYSLLAYHWQSANDPVRAIDYLEKAGDQALYHYANEEAVEFFSEALTLDHDEDEEDRLVSVRHARWEIKMGEAYVNWAKFASGRAHLEQGLALFGYPLPRSQLNLAVGLMGQLWQQLLHRLWPVHYVGRQAAERDTLLESARACEGLTAVYYFANETLASLYTALRSLNLAETAGPSPELARGYASVGVILSFVPLHRLAEAYCRRALKMAQNLHDQPALAWVSLLTGIYYAGVGCWSSARDLLQQVVELAEHLGDWGRHHDGLGNLAMVYYFQGEFNQAIRWGDRLLASAERHSDLHNQGWAWRNQVYCLLPSGRWDEALELLEKLQDLLAKNPHLVDEPLHIDLYGLLALVHLRRREPDLALAAADKAANLVAKTSPTSFLSLPGYAAMVETYLMLWAEEDIYPLSDPGYTELKSKVVNRKSEIKVSARRACKALRGYARVFPIGRPRAYLWQGVFEWLAGRPYLAREQWAKGLVAAERLGMPYARGLIHYEIGRRLPLDAPARMNHLLQAGEIFDRLGATYHLTQAQEALKCTPRS